MMKIYRLKIALADVKPPIWRRLEIASTTKLPIVSQAILGAMGWMDGHLHGFAAMDGTSYLEPDPDFPSDDRNERTAKLSSLVKHIKDYFWYDFDFADGWRHRVTLENIFTSEEDAFPRCVAGKRNCPPEDCGGPYGYRDLLEAVANPLHDRHKEFIDKLPENFDPEEFNLAETNEYMRSMLAGGGLRSILNAD
jgi:hypothetical protein